MANQSWTLSFRVKDADGEVFSVPLYGFSTDTRTLANMQGFVTNTASLLDAILDGQVIQAGLCLDMSLSLATIKASPVSGSEVERTGLIPFLLDYVPPRTFSVDLPAFKYSLFTSGTNQINMADTNVDAFVTALVTAGSDNFTDPTKGKVLTNVQQGVKTFRKHRRQTKRT